MYYIMRKIVIIMVMFSMVLCAGCGKECHPVSTQIELNGDETIQENSSQVISTENKIIVSDKEEHRNVDYADYFADMNGCAVIYSENEERYDIYNEIIANQEISPYSTFKVVSTLIGLNCGVISDQESKMGYDGKIYSVDSWNRDLTLKQAMQTSCIWYFRKILDVVGQEEVLSELKQLNYGNCDISQWNGSDINPEPELNGFWLKSTLKISPKEQVDVIKSVFDGDTIYADKHINILKNVMLNDEVGEWDIYGKTGSNQNKEGWYVGVAESNENRCYFAIYISANEKTEFDISGNIARKIGCTIFENEY